MKRLLIAFLFCLLPSQAFGWMSIIQCGGSTAAVDECAGYLKCQNLEGAGYDHSETWTETVGGTVDEDYTDTILRGAQSLSINDSSGDNLTYSTFTATSPLYFFFRFRPVSMPTGNNSILTIRTATATMAYLSLNGDTGELRGYHGTSYEAAATTLTDGTTYFIWGHYVTGSGADGVLNVWIDTDRTKPASAEITVTNGTSIADPTRIYAIQDNGGQGIYDQILVDDASIGDVPE